MLFRSVTTDELREYGCTVKATDGIVDQLRIIEGIEIAFLLYQTGNPDEYKVSLRTNSAVDVSRIISLTTLPVCVTVTTDIHWKC